MLTEPIVVNVVDTVYMVKRPNFACAASGGVISCSGDSLERPKGVFNASRWSDGVNATLQKRSAELFC